MQELAGHVLNEACNEAARWPQHMRVSVNFSVTQFRSDVLSAIIFDALAQSGLAPGRLELDITKTVILVKAEAACATLEGLRGAGVQIALSHSARAIPPLPHCANCRSMGSRSTRLSAPT